MENFGTETTTAQGNNFAYDALSKRAKKLLFCCNNQTILSPLACCQEMQEFSTGNPEKYNALLEVENYLISE